MLLANTNTRGLLEYWTKGDDPLAARQAYLEAHGFVSLATRTLEDSHRFFTGAGAADLPDRLHVNWIVVAPTPAGIGGAIALGTPPAGWTVPGFHPVHASASAVVLRRDRLLTVGPPTGVAIDRAGRVIVATVAGHGRDSRQPRVARAGVTRPLEAPPPQPAAPPEPDDGIGASADGRGGVSRDARSGR